ncbi:MAG: nucleotidyltransferase domain-containing protein [Bacteriovoracaceae bacterium]|nr:nucleotidyltransferase domain-containing protein [Bacteriovoracaceae bacterium]
MQDRLHFYIYYFFNLRFLRLTAFYYYLFAIKLVTFILSLKKGVQSIYLKGSFGKKQFIPFISDVDFFIVSDDLEARQIEKIFLKLNYFFPMVKDFDLHTKKETKFLVAFAGAKFFDLDHWNLLYGDEISFNYRYHPRKFYLDMIHEIYFQFEWLFYNVKKRNKNDKYRSRVISRQFLKLNNILSYLENHDEGFIYYRSEFMYENAWEEMDNESIIRCFNERVEESSVLNSLHEILICEKPAHAIDEVLSRNYYKENYFEVRTGDFELSAEKTIFLTRKNFELFYFAGAIDSYVLLEWCQTTVDIFAKPYVENLYACRLLQKRTNYVHDKSYYYENEIRLWENYDAIFSQVKIDQDVPYSYLGKKVVILNSHLPLHLAGYKNIYMEFALQKTASSLSKFEHLFIELHDFNEKLDYELSRLRVAISWCFGARRILYIDPGLEEELVDIEFNEDFLFYENRQGGTLGINGSFINWNQIKSFEDRNWGYRSKDILKYLISKQAPNDIKKYLETYLVELSEVSRPEFLCRSIYLNKKSSNEQLLSLLVLLRKTLTYGRLGIIKADPKFEKDIGEIFYLINNKVDPEDYREKIKRIGQKLEISSKFIKKLLNPSLFWNVAGAVEIVNETNNSISCKTTYKNDCELSLKRSFAVDDNYIIKMSLLIDDPSRIKSIQLLVENSKLSSSESLHSNCFEMLLWPTQQKIDVAIDVNLLAASSFHCKIELLEVVSKEKEGDFFRKVGKKDFLKEAQQIKKLYRGFYKILFYMKAAYSGKINYKIDSQISSSGDFSFSSESICAIFLYCPLNESTVTFDLIDPTLIDHIDILYYPPDLF